MVRDKGGKKELRTHPRFFWRHGAGKAAQTSRGKSEGETESNGTKKMSSWSAAGLKRPAGPLELGHGVG